MLGMGGQGDDQGRAGQLLNEVQAVFFSHRKIQEDEIDRVVFQKIPGLGHGLRLPQELDIRKRLEHLAKIGPTKGLVLDQIGAEDYGIHAGRIRLATTLTEDCWRNSR